MLSFGILKRTSYVTGETVRLVYTSVTVKNTVFWDVTPCGSRKYGCFGGRYRLRHQVLATEARHTASHPRRRHYLLKEIPVK
jgi:hypothetical protein